MLFDPDRLALMVHNLAHNQNKHAINLFQTAADYFETEKWDNLIFNINRESF
jgi:hypothetical protein